MPASHPEMPAASSHDCCAPHATERHEKKKVRIEQNRKLNPKDAWTFSHFGNLHFSSFMEFLSSICGFVTQFELECITPNLSSFHQCHASAWTSCAATYHAVECEE